MTSKSQDGSVGLSCSGGLKLYSGLLAAPTRGRRASWECQLAKLGWVLSQSSGRTGMWMLRPLVPTSPLSHEPQGCPPRVTEEGRPFEAEHSDFDIFFNVREVGFCTRLNFKGKSFKLLKISLGATLLEAGWGSSSHTPSCLCPLPQNTSTTGRNKGQNQGKLAAPGGSAAASDVQV